MSEKHDLAWWARAAGNEEDGGPNADPWALFGLLASMELPRDPEAPWWTQRPR